MSNKLSEEALAEWRFLCTGWLNGLVCEPPEFKTEDFTALLDHITALAEELKAAQEERDRLQQVVNIPPNERSVCDCHTWPTIAELHDYTVAMESINRNLAKWNTDFRAKLVEAVRERRDRTKQLIEMACASASTVILESEIEQLESIEILISTFEA